MGLYENKVFPWLLDVTEPNEMAEQRHLLLRDVQGEILEIGIGTGVNLSFYPKQVGVLTAIEPSEAMHARAMHRADASSIKVIWVSGHGEQLPFEGEIFDTIVISDVLCTVGNVDAVLNEAYRVLKPGGRLHFLEHGLSNEGNIKKWQIRLNSLSKVIACGCELTRNIETNIRGSSFKIEELVQVPPFTGINILYPHIRGVAIKPF
jgi:ubiquinone/menaquinone biosynthesis C-methylase UbiE